MANELVLVSSREVREPKHDSHDALSIELEAMSIIGRVLDAIEDPALRQRILNWAAERWGGRAKSTDAAQGTAAIPPADSDLSVDSIGEMFADSPEGRPDRAPIDISPKTERKAPVESMLQSLAADFQRLADEWNGA